MDILYGALLVSDPLIVLTAIFPGSSYWEIDFQSKYMLLLNQNKNIYHGSIKYKKKIFWFIPVSITVTNVNINQPYGVLPYDVYGGGTQKIPTNSFPVTGVVSNSFGFIPSASALNIGNGTVPLNDTDYRKPYIGASPPSSPKNTEFDNFVTHFNKYNTSDNNSPHISFNRRNSLWLVEELNETPLALDCSSFCSNSTIIGENAFCIQHLPTQ